MGRPKSEDSMKERITIRLDRETSVVLNEYCDQENVDRAAGVRRGILKLKGDIISKK